MFSNSSVTFKKGETGEAINAVYSATIQQLKTYEKWNIPFYTHYKLKKKADQLLQIHGIAYKNFNIINNIENLIEQEKKLNDFSIDDNSNKNDKTIKGLIKEATNPFDKVIGYRYLYREMKQVYGKQEATRLSGLMYDYTLGLADSTNILLPYCWAFNATNLLLEGKPFGQLQSSPPKRVGSYISLLNEIVHQMSNHLAGAIAIGTFFIDIAYLYLLGDPEERISFEDLKSKKKIRSKIKNEYQRFVHGVNSLSRSGGQESPFTNVSLFDRVKLKVLLEDMMWMFSDTNGKPLYEMNQIIEYIIELQNLYMEFFDKGDPKQNGMPYRFPVATLNISKKLKDNIWQIDDSKFLNSACKKDIYRYNIFVSEGTKVASCCFYGDEKIKVIRENNEEYITIKDFVKRHCTDDEFLNDFHIERTINTQYYIESINPKTLEVELVRITGILKKVNNTQKLYKIYINGKMIKVTSDHIFLVKHKISGELSEITMEDLKNNFKDYQIQIKN